MKDKLVLFDKTFKPYIPHERIIAAIDGVAEKVNADFRGCKDVPIILCVLNGAIPFTGELLQRLDFKCLLIAVSSATMAHQSRRHFLPSGTTMVAWSNC